MLNFSLLSSRLLLIRLPLLSLHPSFPPPPLHFHLLLAYFGLGLSLSRFEFAFPALGCIDYLYPTLAMLVRLVHKYPLTTKYLVSHGLVAALKGITLVVETLVLRWKFCIDT